VQQISLSDLNIHTSTQELATEILQYGLRIYLLHSICIRNLNFFFFNKFNFHYKEYDLIPSLKISAPKILPQNIFLFDTPDHRHKTPKQVTYNVFNNHKQSVDQRLVPLFLLFI